MGIAGALLILHNEAWVHDVRLVFNAKAIGYVNRSSERHVSTCATESSRAPRVRPGDASTGLLAAVRILSPLQGVSLQAVQSVQKIFFRDAQRAV